MIPPGGWALVQFVADNPGTYMIICISNSSEISSGCISMCVCPAEVDQNIIWDLVTILPVENQSVIWDLAMILPAEYQSKSGI
jgi:hypothetical protein